MPNEQNNPYSWTWKPPSVPVESTAMAEPVPKAEAAEPAWTQALQSARFLQSNYADEATFRQRHPAEAQSLDDYEKALSAWRASRPAKTLAQLAAEEPHVGCDCPECTALICAGYRRYAEEPGVVRWVLMAKPKSVQVMPEPATPPEPAPTVPPLELSKAERERVCALGWLWSLELGEWVYCRPS
jgi:hypothetical protein